MNKLLILFLVPAFIVSGCTEQDVETLDIQKNSRAAQSPTESLSNSRLATCETGIPPACVGSLADFFSCSVINVEQEPGSQNAKLFIRNNDLTRIGITAYYQIFSDDCNYEIFDSFIFRNEVEEFSWTIPLLYANQRFTIITGNSTDTATGIYTFFTPSPILGHNF